MEIVAFSDLHGNRAQLDKIVKLIGQINPDVVLIAGDLTNFGSTDSARALLAELQGVVKGSALIVHGNCDGIEVIRAMQETGWYAHNYTVEIGGESFHGFGDVPTTPFDTLNEASEGAIQAAWCKSIVQRQIWVCHAPPRGLRDHVRGQNVGSTALRALIKAHQPKLYLCGHVHEGCGVSLFDAESGKVEFDQGFTDTRFEQTFDVAAGKTLVVNLAAAKDGRVNRIRIVGNEITVESWLA